MSSKVTVASLLVYLALCGSAFTQDGLVPDRVSLVAPFVDESTFAIAHADLSRIDFSEAVKAFTANLLIPESDKEKSEMDSGLKLASKMREELLQGD